MQNKITIYLSREQSSMASSWTNHLALEKLPGNTWRLGTYGYNWIGSIHDLIPEEDRYDEDGELLVPEYWEGQKIRGLADGEFLETDELVTADYVEFSTDFIHVGRDFCIDRSWSDIPNFELAWTQILNSIKLAPPG
jgi:hypothetical protein